MLTDKGRFCFKSFARREIFRVFQKCPQLFTVSRLNTGLMTLKLKMKPSFILKQCPANIYLFKFNNGNTRKKCEICSKLAIKTGERIQLSNVDFWRNLKILFNSPKIEIFRIFQQIIQCNAALRNNFDEKFLVMVFFDWCCNL